MIPLLLVLLCVYPHKYEVNCEERTVVIEAKRIEFQDYVPLKPMADVRMV